MGLFDSLTGNVNVSPIRRAGAITGAAIPQATQQAVSGLQAGQGTLTDAEKAALAATGSGFTTATGDINKALSLYAPLAGTTGFAESMLSDSLGLGGPEGTQAALGAFQQGPGYQYQLKQGLDALQRGANARGMLSSGNETQDELAFSQNLANQGWQDWQNRLAQFGGQNLPILGAESSLYGGLADIAANKGLTSSGIYGAFAPQIAGTQGQIGATQAGGTMAGAQNKASTLANIFNAQQQAGQNALGFWGGLANPLAYLGGKYMTPTAPTPTPTPVA